MSRYIETFVGNQGSIQIEITDEIVESNLQGDVVKATPLLDEISNKAKSVFTRVLEVTQMISIEFGTKIEELIDPPEEVELSFGLKMDASASTLIAKAGSEAQFQITLKWKRT